MSKRRVVEIYYDTGKAVDSATGMYFVLEDGTVLRHQSTDPIMPFEIPKEPVMTKQESLDALVRDACSVTPVSKSQYRARLEKLLDQEANKRVVEALEELATKAVGVCVFPEDIDAVIEKYKPEEEV